MVETTSTPMQRKVQSATRAALRAMMHTSDWAKHRPAGRRWKTVEIPVYLRQLRMAAYSELHLRKMSLGIRGGR
jgi:hypothetical protein